MTVHHIELDGGFNVRDLGGYPTRDGGVTQSSVLIRAGSLSNITLEARWQLVDYGVKTVIDLRDEWEAETYPDAPFEEIQYRNLPFMGNRLTQNAEWKAEADRRVTMYEVYSYYLDHCQEQIGQIVTAIAESEPTTLFHCYAGKDRTGIISALVLGAVGVPETIIVEDYAETTAHISHLVAEWRINALEHKQDMQRFERDVSSDAHTMRDLLSHIRRHYGGIKPYLQLCGLSESQLDHLKTRLVVAIDKD